MTISPDPMGIPPTGVVPSHLSGAVAPLRIHGESRSRLYKIWSGMLDRCYNPNSHRYHRYGGRGIRVCGAWRYYFPRFRSWALANGYRDDLSIERIDNDGDYSPSNCTWIPMNEQGRNTWRTRSLTAWGETKLVVDWVKGSRCRTTSREAILGRIRRGWSPEQAIGLR